MASLDSKSPPAAAPVAATNPPQQLSSTGGQLGRDSSRQGSGQAVTVSATWAQNAVNAYRASRRESPLIAVDGRSGQLTIGALRQISSAVAPGQPAPKNSPDERTSPRVTISLALEEALARIPAVQPPRRRAAGSAGSSVAVVDGQAVEVVEEAGDFVQENLPWIIGGSAAVAAVVVGFIVWRSRSRRTVSANRRTRRHK